VKQQRQKAILDLILREEIETQDDLTARLIALGFPVTQATVSRDIKELRLIKTQSRSGKNRYVTGDADRDATQIKQLRIFVESVNSLDIAGNLMVLRTLPGSAQAAAGTLDDMKIPEILGCIAGDDTILAVLRTPEDAEGLRGRLGEILQGV